jgi:hypothetical protein
MVKDSWRISKWKFTPGIHLFCGILVGRGNRTRKRRNRADESCLSKEPVIGKVDQQKKYKNEQ